MEGLVKTLRRFPRRRQSAFRKSGTAFAARTRSKSLNSRARFNDQTIPSDRIVL